MKSHRVRWMVLGVNILCALGLFIFSSPEYNLKYIINSIFYIFLIYFTLLLILWVTKGAFFDPVIWSFRRFRFIMSKSKDHLLELEEKKYPSERISIPFYRGVRFQTWILGGIVVVLLVGYYV